MQPEEEHDIACALGSEVIRTQALAGGFSHETSLVTLTDGQVVARLGETDPMIEAAVMAAAGRCPGCCARLPPPATVLVR